MNVNPEAEVLVFGEDNRAKATASRPLATFALFAYNQEAFIREAVEGAFAQVYEPLEIILSDDFSTDQTYDVIKELAYAYTGPHRLLVCRNKRNLGLSCHINAVLNIANGAIVVLAAGDDVSYPSRTATSVSLMQGAPLCSSVLISADVIDSNSVVVGKKYMCHPKIMTDIQCLNRLLKHRAKTFGAGRAIKKSVWKEFPPLASTCPTEDTPLLLRSLMCGPIILSAKKELAYRRHETNLSGVASILSMNLDYISKQYEQDIRHALAAEIITDFNAFALARWVKTNIRSRVIENKLQASFRLTANDLYFVLVTPAWPTMIRFKILLRYLSSFFVPSGPSR